MIWEFVTTERSYCTLLAALPVVYRELFPYNPTNKDEASASSMKDRKRLHEALFSSLDELNTVHTCIFGVLLKLHNENDSHIVEHLGSCLLRLLDDKMVDKLAKLYGDCMFTKRHLPDLVKRCRLQPSISKFIEDCQTHPRTSRRSPVDCLDIIANRWTKVKLLVMVIMDKTPDQPDELEALEQVAKKVHHLLTSAEIQMTEREHEEKLREFHSLMVMPDKEKVEVTTYERLMAEMQCSTTKLINYDQLLVYPSGDATTKPVTVIGVALNACFFLLERVPDTPNYRLYVAEKMLAVIWWTRHQGFFRRSCEKSGFTFFIVITSENILTWFRCQTMVELSRWETIMRDGFSKFRGENYVDLTFWKDNLQHKRSELSKKWANTEKWLELLLSLDNTLLRTCTARALAFRAATHETLSSGQLLMELEMDRRDSVKSTNEQDDSPQRSKTESPVDISPQQIFDLQPNFISDDGLRHKASHAFGLFNEILKTTARALIGQTSLGVTRSASDVRVSKAKKKQHPVRKIKTFSAPDSLSGTVEPKSLLRKGNRRDEDSGLSMCHIKTQLDTPDLPDDLVSNFSRLTARLKDKQLVEQVLLSMDSLYQCSQELCVIICEAQAKSTEQEASIAHLTASLANAESTIDQMLKDGVGLKPSSDPTSKTGNTTGASSHNTTLMQQETEKLRRQYEKFTQECAAWEKKRLQEASAIERKQESLAKDRQKLADELAELARARAVYEENCKTLQQQINLYSPNIGSDLDILQLPELKIEQPLDTVRPEHPSHRSGVSLLSTQQMWRQSGTFQENESFSESERKADSSYSLFPDHVSGSLLNESQHEPSDSDRPDKLPNIKYTDSESSLARLVSTSKPKKKKSNIFKR